MPFKSGEGRPPINISESEIRYAMSNTQSCMAAARFLNVSYDSFRKYSGLYKDKETGKTLFELHKNRSGKGMKKSVKPKMHGHYGLMDILEGKYPTYKPNKLKPRLLRSGLVEEKCELCGFDERRITDYTVPLILDYKDEDRTNHKRDNIQLLCHNCYYLTVGNPLGGRPKKSF
tara:strand:+ start:49618 stop:50139 length:522 start_codon:yes stop_codon:yes gene_type:complete